MVYCGQYCRGRKITVLSSCQDQAPTTGLDVRSSMARSTAALLLIARLNMIVMGMPTPNCLARISEEMFSSVPRVVILALKVLLGLNVWKVCETITFLWFAPMAVAVTVYFVPVASGSKLRQVPSAAS